MLQCAQRITEMHQNISEHVPFFKVLALDRAVRNLYISSCIFRCLHQESEKWTTKSSSGVVPVLFEQHNRSEFPMAPAQSGPLPQRNRCGIFCNSQGQPLLAVVVAGYAGQPGSMGTCRPFWGNLALRWSGAIRVKTLFAKRNLFLARSTFFPNAVFISICRFSVAVAFVIDGTCSFCSQFCGSGCVESCWVFGFDFDSGRRILYLFWGGQTI